VKIAEVRATVAKYVNAPKDNLFMVENASDGFNGFAKSIKWKEGDVIAMPNTSYAMVKRTVDYLIDKYKVRILSVWSGGYAD
jgi:selenocysteine lyase/cysteine desulfurase